VLGAHAQTVDDGREGIPLLEAIFTKGLSKIGSERRNVSGTAREQHAVNVSRLEARLVERSPDRLADEVELRSDHGLEGRTTHRHPVFSCPDLRKWPDSPRHHIWSTVT
jgi:hypothetical protein